MFKAQIYFDSVEDSFTEGELLDGSGTSWEETLTAETREELKTKVLEATYSKWEDVDDDQANEYDWCTEYSTSYLADANNEGDASAAQIEEWKQGKLRLWAVNCHILVTEVTEKKASF